jgi:hypothetical protein
MKTREYPQEIKVGSRVVANWGAEISWSRGTIKEIEDGTVTIKWDADKEDSESESIEDLEDMIFGEVNGIGIYVREVV